MKKENGSYLVVAGILGLIIYFSLKSKKGLAKGKLNISDRPLSNDLSSKASVPAVKSYSDYLNMNVTRADYVGPFKVIYT